MIRKLITSALFSSFMLISISAISQEEYSIPLTKEIKIIKGDSTTIAEVNKSNTELKINHNKRYYWYNNGQIHSNIGGYHGSLLNGKFELFITDKLVLQGFFNNGLKNGLWKIWKMDGGYSQTFNWENGSLNGETTSYYINGVQKDLYEYAENKKNGEYKLFDKNGNITEIGTYKNNLKDGTITIYQNDGSKKIEKYSEGELISSKENNNTKWQTFLSNLKGKFRKKE